MHFDSHRAAIMIDALEIDAATKTSMQKSFERKIELFGSDIRFFPEPFTPISLTGTRCKLECKHCNSHYLSHMFDGSGGKLYSQVRLLKDKGAEGILLSGGSNENGSVPTYLSARDILKIKQEMNLKISAHTGIVDESQAHILSGYLDMALVDVIGSDETIHDIIGIDASVRDYEDSLRALSSAGIPLAPHVIVGLHNGKLRGELKALEIARKFNPKVVVIVIFIPTKGTALEGTASPMMEDVVRVIAQAREIFNVPLSLSCVRPGGRYRSMLDRYAILAGVDRIAVPSRNAYATSRELGLDIVEIRKMCCSY